MMREISSKENKIVKECQRLARRKYRDREGRYLIEGENLLEEALQNEAEIDFVLYDERREFPYDFSGRLYRTEHGVFAQLAQTETSQGLLAVVRKETYEGEQLSDLCLPGSNLLILDRLQDPGNIGTLLRTAEGAGYAAVVSVKGTADIYSPKAVRAAAGSVFRIPVIPVENSRELAGLCSRLKKKLTVTCPDGGKAYYDTELQRDIALVIGNEGNGVSPELMETAEIKVKIPMAGRLESLNAAVAAGILMYEAVRGRGI